MSLVESTGIRACSAIRAISKAWARVCGVWVRIWTFILGNKVPRKWDRRFAGGYVVLLSCGYDAGVVLGYGFGRLLGISGESLLINESGPLGFEPAQMRLFEKVICGWLWV